MDEEKIAAIESRGYDPTVIIAIMHLMQTGLFDKLRSDKTRALFVARREENLAINDPREKGKSRLTADTTRQCVCVSCGEITKSTICQHCGHDNYEIMLLKGEKICQK